jgi:hypothetical protein
MYIQNLILLILQNMKKIILITCIIVLLSYLKIIDSMERDNAQEKLHKKFEECGKHIRDLPPELDRMIAQYMKVKDFHFVREAHSLLYSNHISMPECPYNNERMNLVTLLCSHNESQDNKRIHVYQDRFADDQYKIIVKDMDKIYEFDLNKRIKDIQYAAGKGYIFILYEDGALTGFKLMDGDIQQVEKLILRVDTFTISSDGGKIAAVACNHMQNRILGEQSIDQFDERMEGYHLHNDNKVNFLLGSGATLWWVDQQGEKIYYSSEMGEEIFSRQFSFPIHKVVGPIQHVPNTSLMVCLGVAWSQIDNEYDIVMISIPMESAKCIYTSICGIGSNNSNATQYHFNMHVASDGKYVLLSGKKTLLYIPLYTTHFGEKITIRLPYNKIYHVSLSPNERDLYIVAALSVGTPSGLYILDRLNDYIQERKCITNSMENNTIEQAYFLYSLSQLIYLGQQKDTLTHAQKIQATLWRGLVRGWYKERASYLNLPKTLSALVLLNTQKEHSFLYSNS